MPNLHQLGWSRFFADQLTELEEETSRPARVVSGGSSLLRLLDERGERPALLGGALLHGAGRVCVVGDWVLVGRDGREDPIVVERILDRRTCLSRKSSHERNDREQVLASNVDTVFLMSSLNRDFNLGRIERYLALAWESGAEPVILLNKEDLCDDVAEALALARSVAPGVAVHSLSALMSTGLEVLTPYLVEGRTATILGSSGCGKSTLINRLLGVRRQEVRSIREGDDRGRHTTTSRDLILLPGGGMVIDMPGMRSVGLWDAADGLDRTFPEIEEVAGRCRYRDCSHTVEEGCALLEGVAQGDIDGRRLRSYLKLQRELAYLAQKHDAGVQRSRKRRGKQLSRYVRDLERSKEW